MHIAFIASPVCLTRFVFAHQPFWSIFHTKGVRAVFFIAIISTPIAVAGIILSLLPSLEIFLLVS